jgi:hypothetical protein
MLSGTPSSNFSVLICRRRELKYIILFIRTRRTFAEEARKQQDVQVSQGESGKGVATRTRPRGVSDPRDWVRFLLFPLH